MVFVQCGICYFLFLFLFCVEGIIHEPRNSKKGLIEPVVVEYTENVPLESVLSNTKEKFADRYHSRNPRSTPKTTPPGFGTTVKLTGDHHTYGLVHWSGKPRERIFILTRKRGSGGYSTESFLWISKNYGKTFENITNMFPSDAVAEWYYISSNADILIFTDRINNRLYVTLDEGDSFTAVNLSFTPDSLRFQSSRVPDAKKYEQHVLAYDRGTKKLWVSGNAGLNWTKIGDNVTRYAWRELNSTCEDPTVVYFDQKVNDTTVLLYTSSNASGNGYKTQLFDSKLGAFMPGTFVLSYQYMFIQRNYTQIGQGTSTLSPLWVSHRRGMFQPATFPLELNEKHYALIDSSENQVMMAVYHDPNNTHLYLSEEAGMNYTLSLDNIISPPESDWIDSYPTFDVYVVESIIGTYLANRKIPTSTQGYTVISFDKGGEWTPVTPPATDSNGLPITCNLPCSLHLHMYIDESSGFQPILSQDTAPGIIMALGNIGESLNRFDFYGLRLYISDNGGVIWRELYSGYKEFQLLNYGVFTAVVDKWIPAFYVLSSCDEGYHWENYTFTNNSEKINVVRMLTEYGEAAQHVTIFGYYPGVSFATFEWLVIDLDFTTLNLSQCQQNDYYLWKPTDEREGQQCILGESIEYERRLPDHCCYINVEYDRPINRTVCECTDEDFECEVNFERVDLDGPCVPMNGYQYPPDPPNTCTEGANYSYTSGYRQIAGDKCVVGSETFFLPMEAECPVMAPGDIDLMAFKPSELVNKSITFNFTQGQGAKIVTQYEWSYGDGSDNVIISGYSNAMSTNHTYHTPGDYIVSITASNNGGQGVDDIHVFISDVIVNVTIIAPRFISAEAPVNFFANVTTKYGTKYLEYPVYTWKFHGETEVRSTPYISHTFTSVAIGTVNIEVTVSYIGGISESSLQLTVEEPPPNLQLSVSIDGTPKERNGFLPVNQEIDFTVSPLENKTFTEDTSFHWLMLFGDGTHLYDNTITDNHLTYSLPLWDNYILSVTRQNSAGVAKVTAFFLAEEIIDNVIISNIFPVYRANKIISANLDIQSTNNDSYIPYMGTLAVEVYSGPDNQVGSNRYVLPGNESKVNISFLTFVTGTYNLSIYVYNNVSTKTVQQPIMVATSVQYGYVRLIFQTTSLDSNYHNYEWQKELQMIVHDELQTMFNLSSWQLEVNVTEENNTTSTNMIKKRNHDEKILTAHVFILPVDLSTTAINNVESISDDLITQAKSGQLKFTVNGSNVAVKTLPTSLTTSPATTSATTSVSSPVSTISSPATDSPIYSLMSSPMSSIYSPMYSPIYSLMSSPMSSLMSSPMFSPVTTSPVSSSAFTSSPSAAHHSNLPLALGVGIGGFVLILTAIIIVVGIACWRKKRHLSQSQYMYLTNPQDEEPEDDEIDDDEGHSMSTFQVVSTDEVD